jgi:hypothetical protein
MSDEMRQLYERLSPEDLASLPAELRAEMSRQGATSATSESRRQARALAAVERIPLERRDMTPVLVLCHAKNTPWGNVYTDEQVEVTVEDGVELIKVEDGRNAKGEPKFKVVEVKKFRKELQMQRKLTERTLHYKERVSMPRWVVDLMVGNDQVVEIQSEGRAHG